MKVQLAASDALLANQYSYIDMESIVDISPISATLVISTTSGALTFTFDGDDAAEKLLNASKMANYIAPRIIEYVGGKPKKDTTIFNLLGDQTIAELHTATGIVHTSGSANTALISIVAS
tara:strand:+ start:130 stop:489 length:360 start_codon:yes stop_codon:yes gene_type:complete